MSGRVYRGNPYQMMDAGDALATIGDMTSGGGLAAGFDGDSTKTLAASAEKLTATSGYIGLQLARPMNITFCYVYGSTDQGFVNGATPTVTLDVYGKQGATAPTSSTDGTVLGSLSFTDATGAARSVDCYWGDWVRYWDWVWVRVSQNGAAATMGVALIAFDIDFQPEDVLNLQVPLANGGRGKDFNLNNPLVCGQNVLTASMITANQEDADFPATNLANPSTSSIWKATSTSTKEITMTTLGVAEIGYIGLAGHNWAGAQVRAFGTPHGYGVDVFETILDLTSIPDNGPLLIYIDQQNWDYLYLDVVGPTEIPQAAVIMAGPVTRLQRRLYVGHRPGPYQRETNAVQGTSESGNFLGRIILGRTIETEITQTNISPDWYRSELDPLLLDAEEQPFFFAWRPDDYPGEVIYCWLTGDPKPSNILPNGMMDVSFPVKGIS